MPPIKLSQEQVNNLARPIVGMVETIADFFKNPQNDAQYMPKNTLFYLEKATFL